MRTCFLLGWHGTMNIGDDLMAILYINEVEDKYDEIYSFKRFYQLENNMVLSKYKAIRKMFTSDDLMVSGGNIFLISSKKSYLKLILFFTVFYFRKFFSKPTYIDSIGLDLKVGKFNRYILLKVLNQVHSVSVREHLSYRYLKYTKVFLNHDYHLEINYDRVYRYDKELLTKYKVDKIKNNLLWFISGQPASKDINEAEKTKKTLSLIESKHRLNELNITFFCQNKEDIKRVEKILSRNSLIQNCKVELYNYKKLKQQMEMISSSDFVIAERYHGGILAEAMQLKWYKLAFSEKLERAYLPNKYCLNC